MFDEATRRRLYAISRARTVTDDDLLYVKEVARKREELFQKVGGTDRSRLVKAVSDEVLGDAIHRVMGEVERKLISMELGERLIQEDVAATMREARERSINPMKHPQVREVRQAYDEHIARTREILEELSNIFAEAPLLYHVYVQRRKGKIHPLIDQAFAWAKEKERYRN